MFCDQNPTAVVDRLFDTCDAHFRVEPFGKISLHLSDGGGYLLSGVSQYNFFLARLTTLDLTNYCLCLNPYTRLFVFWKRLKRYTFGLGQLDHGMRSSYGHILELRATESLLDIVGFRLGGG